MIEVTDADWFGLWFMSWFVVLPLASLAFWFAVAWIVCRIARAFGCEICKDK